MHQASIGPATPGTIVRRSTMFLQTGEPCPAVRAPCL